MGRTSSSPSVVAKPTAKPVALRLSALIGMFSITGMAGSYARMLMKVMRFNQVRAEKEQLKSFNKELSSAFSEFNSKLLADEKGFTQASEVEMAGVPKEILLPEQTWRLLRTRLPRPLGYAVSVTHDDAVIVAGVAAARDVGAGDHGEQGLVVGDALAEVGVQVDRVHPSKVGDGCEG